MKERKGTLWIEYYVKGVLSGFAHPDSDAGQNTDEAKAAFKVLLDSLYGAIRKRNRRDGSGERAALFEIKAQIRSVYPSLSFDAKPSTVAKFVKRLVEDLGNARRAVNRAMLPALEGLAERERHAEEPVTLGNNIAFTGPGLIPDPRGWKADPPAPETLKSSPNASGGQADYSPSESRVCEASEGGTVGKEPLGGYPPAGIGFGG